jgi:nickel-dependent lactate racemase
MPVIAFPYGTGTLDADLPDDRFLGALVSALHEYKAPAAPEELVRESIRRPVSFPQLRALAVGKKKVVVIASDHTRPVPSKIIIPPLLEEIRWGNPRVDITLLIATGCHRGTTQEELAGKFGEDVVAREHIVVHDCDASPTVDLGELPSGGRLVVNKLAVEADLLVAEGFIEPHFFAGFSGGRKSVLPGIASRETVLYNHNAEFIGSPFARAGILANNPIHADMRYAARVVNLAFICNVVINSAKEVVYAVSGGADSAHKAGCCFLSERCQADALPADIVITTNGGYPLDQNIYQAVKGMTAAEATVKKGGVIIMCARSNDGHGGEAFFNAFRGEKNLERMAASFARTPKQSTRVDQWESQVLCRVLRHAHVVYVSDADDDVVREFQMLPAHSLEEALGKAEELLHNPRATITAIPDGVSVIVRAAPEERAGA